MSRETIAVDVDDVIADHAAAFAEFSNTNYGTNITREEYTEKWMDLWGIDNWDEVERRAAEFHVPETTAGYLLINDSQEVLTELAKQFNLAVVTARPKASIDATHEWLDNHFSGLFSEVHFVPIWQPNNTVTKADICRQIDADYLIDDLARHCNVAAQVGITALLFGNYAWNGADQLEESVIKVSNWQEVREFFSAKA